MRRAATATNNNRHNTADAICVIILILNITMACYNYFFYSYGIHLENVKNNNNYVASFGTMIQPPSSQTKSQQNQQQQQPIIENDGLVWITPKPTIPRHVGYEDDWLMTWKTNQYSITNNVGCFQHQLSERIYNDDIWCTLPAYIPARYVAPPPPPLSSSSTTTAVPTAKSMISKVIFVSWFDRRIGKALYTSLMTLIQHNPEYEFIFFNDDDVDHFFCDTTSGHQLHDSWAIPILSRVRAGAMRADIWRLLIMQRYGGVYVDSDISATSKLPIYDGDTVVSGIGGWGHLPGTDPTNPENTKVGGLLEHWAMAYMPNHPYINAAVDVMKHNLLHPEYLLREDTPEYKAEDSATVRLTGPAMYQHTLHTILHKAQCTMIDNSFVNALLSPDEYCADMQTFRSYFPNGRRFFAQVNFNDTLVHKIFNYASVWAAEVEDIRTWNYDDESLKLSNVTDPAYCDRDSFTFRALEREKIFHTKPRPFCDQRVACNEED